MSESQQQKYDRWRTLSSEERMAVMSEGVDDAIKREVAALRAEGLPIWVIDDAGNVVDASRQPPESPGASGTTNGTPPA